MRSLATKRARHRRRAYTPRAPSSTSPNTIATIPSIRGSRVCVTLLATAVAAAEPVGCPSETPVALLWLEAGSSDLWLEKGGTDGMFAEPVVPEVLGIAAP